MRYDLYTTDKDVHIDVFNDSRTDEPPMWVAGLSIPWEDAPGVLSKLFSSLIEHNRKNRHGQ